MRHCMHVVRYSFASNIWLSDFDALWGWSDYCERRHSWNLSNGFEVNEILLIFLIKNYFQMINFKFNFGNSNMQSNGRLYITNDRTNWRRSRIEYCCSFNSRSLQNSLLFSWLCFDRYFLLFYLFLYIFEEFWKKCLQEQPFWPFSSQKFTRTMPNWRKNTMNDVWVYYQWNNLLNKHCLDCKEICIIISDVNHEV